MNIIATPTLYLRVLAYCVVTFTNQHRVHDIAHVQDETLTSIYAVNEYANILNHRVIKVWKILIPWMAHVAALSIHKRATKRGRINCSL